MRTRIVWSPGKRPSDIPNPPEPVPALEKEPNALLPSWSPGIHRIAFSQGAWAVPGSLTTRPGRTEVAARRKVTRALPPILTVNSDGYLRLSPFLAATLSTGPLSALLLAKGYHACEPAIILDPSACPQMRNIVILQRINLSWMPVVHETEIYPFQPCFCRSSLVSLPSTSRYLKLIRGYTTPDIGLTRHRALSALARQK